MSPPNEKPGWLDHPKAGARIYYALLALCAGLMLLDLTYTKHVHYDFEGWVGFYGFYGFVSCVGLVLAAKELRKIVMRDEDYYE